ncbi:hypothetical protein [Deinococcus navajonensis]|uniref:P pilus assembly chaperone PapD n=1 Tax=Deinococcus navajonensis TaxID=309884 RepID=A0ABV8XRK8_9DEIO
MRINSRFLFLTLLAATTTVSAQVQVSSALVMSHNLASGQRAADGVLTLSNPGDTPAQARITLNDIKSDPKAGVVYLKAGALPRSNASWINLPSSSVTVPAHGKVSVPYHITIPQNASQGTYWSVLLVQPVTAENVVKNQTPNNIVIKQVTQYAVQVLVNLPGGQAHLKFKQPELVKTADGITLNVELTNTGERLSLPTTHAEIYDAQGKLVQKVVGRDRRVYPGLSVLETYQISGLKPGKYQVLVIADDKDNDVVGARYNITVE